MTDKILALLKSRRFLTAVSGVVIVALSESFGMSEEQLLTMSGIIISWIVGDSLRVTK